MKLIFNLMEVGSLLRMLGAFGLALCQKHFLLFKKSFLELKFFLSELSILYHKESEKLPTRIQQNLRFHILPFWPSLSFSLYLSNFGMVSVKD